MRSAWITGPETLGMTPPQDQAYPLSGRVSVPRQVVETMGCILEDVVYANQRGFLEVLAGMLEGSVREAFYAAFLVVFGMLKGCGDVSGDRYRYARENFKEVSMAVVWWMEMRMRWADTDRRASTNPTTSSGSMPTPTFSSRAGTGTPAT